MKTKVLLCTLAILSLGLIFLSFKGKKENTGYQGIDVSRYQKEIDWKEVAKDKNIPMVLC
ncbi:hypothetical protein M2137_000032 [Parabacteroides sp. PFB2-10]|uniref:hypothetical protein n=1 Tax=Parabacteroides sp. PFB2-10 TaxID=1742405 RepID=UPI0024735EB1|nr:hypothetical protein [Parabacteroides sp. PFB2-10]MDH6311282.1 hypothetical protein [Parabacteroides sp. PFB2-10]